MFRAWIVAAALSAMGPVGAASAWEQIIGGTNAPAGSWPSIAAIFPAVDTDYLRTFCGGTLIDPQWVLTAAHCLVDPAADQATEIDVALGVTNLVTDAGQRRDVDQIARHPGWANDTTFTNDVALLHLSTPAVIGAGVAPIAVVSPLRPDLWDGGSPAEIAGWGETGSGLATALQQASISMISDSTCNSLMGSGPNPVFVASSMVCAGNLAGGFDACQGDSGGPLTIPDGAVRKLVGAVSWGIGCAQPNLPGVYSRLDVLRGFIFGPQGLNASAPTSPTGVSATAGQQSATVSWTASASNGGRAIQHYGVRVIQDGVSGQLIVVPATSSQATITGLAAGSSYTFTVLAATDAALSPPSPPSLPVVPGLPAPVNVQPPSVTGAERQGATLTASDGTWNFLGTITRAWQRCDAGGAGCVDVPGATGATLVLGDDDVGHRVRLRVTATNTVGPTVVSSAPSEVILPMPPTPRSAPTISGLARVGRPLSGFAGDPVDLSADPYRATNATFAWQSCDASLTCIDIGGATTAQFVATRDQVGRRIRLRVTWTNAGGSTHVVSQPTDTVLPPFRIVVVKDRRIVQTRNGRIVVTMAVRLEAGARLRVRLVSPQGGAVTPLRRLSRVNGAIPHVADADLLATAPRNGRVHIRLVAPGTAAGPIRTGSIRLVATALPSERATSRMAVSARF